MNRAAAIARRTDATPLAQSACRHGHGCRAPAGARLDRLQLGLASPSRTPAIIVSWFKRVIRSAMSAQPCAIFLVRF